jgi:hypothetical protein
MVMKPGDLSSKHDSPKSEEADSFAADTDLQGIIGLVYNIERLIFLPNIRWFQLHKPINLTICLQRYLEAETGIFRISAEVEEDQSL